MLNPCMHLLSNQTTEEIDNPVRIEITKFLTEFQMSNAGVTALLKMLKKISVSDAVHHVQALPSSARSFLRHQRRNENQEDHRLADSVDSESDETEKEGR